MQFDRRLPRSLVPWFCLAVLLPLVSALSAQEPSSSEALQRPTAPNAEMQKWIETVDAQWQATFEREVTAPFEQEKAKAVRQYMAGLEAGFAKASSAGNLDLTVLWRDERDRFAREKEVPLGDDPASPAELKPLRASWHGQRARMENDRVAHTKSVYARYDQVLAQAQTQLTQRQRLDDALLVKKKRDEIAAVWGASAAAPIAENAGTRSVDPAAILAGTWKVVWPQNGWMATRTFNKDGTATTSDAGAGTWSVVDGKSILLVLAKYQERYDLPLNPEGMKVLSNKNRELTATKDPIAAATPVPVIAAPKTAQSPAPNLAPLKALLTGSRWQWFDGPEPKGKAYWVEFYRDGAMFSQWGEAYHWELVSASTVKISGGKSGKAEWFLAVDMAKKEARPDSALNRTGARSMSFEKHISSVPPKGLKF